MAAAPAEAALQASKPAMSLEKLHLEVAALRLAVNEILMEQRRELQHAAWVRGMEAQRSTHRVGRLAGVTSGLALVTAGLVWGTVASGGETAPMVLGALTGGLTVASAIALGRVIHKRRLITREIRAHAR